MTEDELKALEKQVKKLKRVATERAGEVHDLVEDRLLSDYKDLPDMAQATVEACKAWEEANRELKAAQS